jgi:hypothetical protein
MHITDQGTCECCSAVNSTFIAQHRRRAGGITSAPRHPLGPQTHPAAALRCACAESCTRTDPFLPLAALPPADTAQASRLQGWWLRVHITTLRTAAAGHMQRHVWNCVGGMTTVLSVTRACAAPHCASPCPGATPAGPPPTTCPSCRPSSAPSARLSRPPCRTGRLRLRQRRPLLPRCCHCRCVAQQISLQQHPGWRLPALEPPCIHQWDVCTEGL